MQVSVETADRFAVTVELGDVEAGDSSSKNSRSHNHSSHNHSSHNHSSDNRISESSFSVQMLVAAQGLDASFGLPDHRKRKAPTEEELLPSKRRWTGGAVT